MQHQTNNKRTFLNVLFNWTMRRSFVHSTKSIILPGFQGLSIYEVGKFFVREIKDARINEKVAAVTYNFVMAIPPTFLFLFSLVPYLPLKGKQHNILATLKIAIPNKNLYDNISKVVIDFMTKERKDVLSLGILLTLYFSSNGLMGLMRSFDGSLSIHKKRSALARRWTALKLTFVLMCVLIVSISVLIAQGNLFNKWEQQIFHSLIVVKFTSFLILVMIIFFAISIIYAYGPSLTHKFKLVSAGSVFATIMIVIGTYVFFYLVNNTLNYNKVYGSLGTLIAFMVWIWLNTMIILIGYELNVSILLGKISQDKNVIDKKNS